MSQPKGAKGEPMGEVRVVTDKEFETTVNDNDWVLVDFWAPWCSPCKALGPVLAQVAGERELIVAKVDTDSNPMNAAAWACVAFQQCSSTTTGNS